MDKAEYLEKYIELNETCGYKFSLGRARVQLAMLNSHPDVVGKPWLKTTFSGCADHVGRGGDYGYSEPDLSSLTKEELDFIGVSKEDLELLSVHDDSESVEDLELQKKLQKIEESLEAKGLLGDFDSLSEFNCWVPSIC